jgi:AmmeMemoRadiSam system protein B/AmmeMemoRadiSam system protein A
MATAELTNPPPPAARTARLDLTAGQRETLLTAVGELIRAATTGRPGSYPDPTLAGAAHLPVAGAFVSLKRGKHLRGCCGGLQNQPVPLGRAVAEAASRTVLDDERFPPVSPAELAHLNLEVWLLHSPERMQARSEDRVAAVTVGRHGLVIVRGQSRGLLLPGVATDHDWDARRFLEQACVKAGLHPSLWKDNDTTVLTFEGDVLRGRVPAGEPAEHPVRREDLAAYLQFCRDNLRALLTGALPTYYLYNVSDANVSGVALSVARPGGDRLDLSRISFRPGVPLQSTLYSMTQEAAHRLASSGIPFEELDDLIVSLTVLADTNLHGSAAEPDLAGIVADRRAVLIVERSRAGLVFDPKLTAADLLSEAVKQAQVFSPATAAVYSLAALTSEARVAVSTAPRPLAGPAVRPPGVAGRFYPADPAKLATLVDQLLGDERGHESWPAAMVPHAGLVYSGQLAARTLRRLRLPRTVIVLGPKHTPQGMDWAVAPHETWSLPGVKVASDPELARRLVQAIPGLTLDAAAHQQEHGIEVELPFLARLAPQTKVVGIAIGHGDLPSCRRFAEGLAQVVGAMKEPPLLLISSDMNHFATDAETRVLDEMALRALEGLDPANVYETVTDNQISMCGVLPAVIVLETLRRLGRLTKAERVGYATSADVSGDTSRVVGYAGMLFG